MNKVALLGYGRFGRAFSELLMEAGMSVKAFDPHAEVDAELRADNLPDLVAGADVVLLAPPVSQLRAALAQIAPYLTPNHLVMDVGSVKVEPTRALDDALGARVPWVATHPLFGPLSLARAERPMRVVVCPNKRHPHSLARAKDFYERVECEVLEQAAEEHDQLMARTHALAFFVAKGILDSDKALADNPPPFVPPSFLGLSRTIDAVRADAGHLYRAVEQDNPYAADVRQALIEALVHADRELVNAVTMPPPSTTGVPTDAFQPEALTIPDLGLQSAELREARSHIDTIDRELVVLLSRRAELSARAGSAKRAMGHGVLDTGREARLIAARRQWAKESGLEPNAVDDVFQAILRLSRGVQRKDR
jgi:prephenate dehydrogenase